MPVHDQVQPLLDAMAAAGGPALHEMEPAAARAMFEAMRVAPPELPELASVTDTVVPGTEGHDVPIRVYVPKDVDHPGVCMGFVRRAAELVSSGRPPCTLCGRPLDPEGHVCIKTNGHLH